MSFSFLSLVEEKFADIIARQALEIVFTSSFPRWVRILFANETRGISVQWEPQDGYIDVRYGIVPRRSPSSPMDWNSTRHFHSLRSILHEQGVDIPAGMYIYRPPELAAVLDEFVREVVNREQVIFGTNDSVS